MSLALPGMLMWILPLGGAIVALYFLKMKRKDVVVPASFLWPNLQEEVRANSFFQKLRPNLLLFLQLLALALLVFCLANPQLLSKGLGGTRTVVVVDTSASMQATDVSPSRMEAALSQVYRSIADMQPTDQMAIVEAGVRPKVLASFSSDRSQLTNALSSARPTDADTDVAEAMRLASSLCLPYENSKIVLLSDGVFEDLRDFSPGRAGVDYISIGKSGENVGFRAFSVNESLQGRLLFVSLRNYGTKSKTFQLRLYADGAIFQSNSNEISGGGTFSKSFAIPSQGSLISGTLEVKGEDVLAADNEAQTLSDPMSKLQVLLVGEDYFWERALALEPRVVLDKARSLPPAAREGASRKYDLVVFAGADYAPTNARAVLEIATNRSPLVSARGTLANPKGGDIENHPLNKDVSFGRTFFENAPKISPKDGKVVARFSSGDPMIVESKKGDRHSVYLAISSSGSDFPLQPDFPILVSNVVSYLCPPGASRNLLTAFPGQVLSFTAQDSTPLRITFKKSGTSIEPSLNRYTIRGLERVGTYELDAPGLRRTILVSMDSDAKSDCRPRPQILIGKQSKSGLNQVSHLSDKWPYLAALAMLVLSIEWIAFLRRC